MINELKLLNAINTAAYNTFAYRLGADEWEEAETEFQKHLASELVGTQQAVQGGQAKESPVECDCTADKYCKLHGGGIPPAA